MSYTTTSTETWSRTHARRVAGKVAADLRGLGQAYGWPSETYLDALLEELTEYLAAGYLERVTYGFVRGETWVVALEYTADRSGELTRDDRSGSIPRGRDTAGAYGQSYLERNAAWWRLSPSEREKFEERLPVQRTPGTKPSGRSGWLADRVYSSAGQGVSRAIIG